MNSFEEIFTRGKPAIVTHDPRFHTSFETLEVIADIIALGMTMIMARYIVRYISS